MSSSTAINWVAVQLATGAIIADLPGIEIQQGALPVLIGQPQTAVLALNLNTKTPSNWMAATQPGGAAMIAWTGDPAAPTILWGGIVRQRSRSIGPKVLLSCQTPESYLEGCYVGTYNGTNLNQDTIVAGLMAFAMGTNRVPWVLNNVNPSTQTQTANYTPTSNVSVLSALQTLSAFSGGPEWTASWQWNLSAGTIVPLLTYGQRIGQAATGPSPAVTITQRDLAAEATFTEDYTDGYGANQVTAYGTSTSSGSGTGSSTVVPSATGTASDLKGRPLWTYVYQPSANVTDPSALAQFAASAVNQIQDGSQPLSLTMARQHGVSGGWGPVGKQLGQDWGLGDDIGWNITGVAFPTPITGVARVLGYSLTYDTVTPILQGANLG